MTCCFPQWQTVWQFSKGAATREGLWLGSPNLITNVYYESLLFLRLSAILCVCVQVCACVCTCKCAKVRSWSQVLSLSFERVSHWNWNSQTWSVSLGDPAVFTSPALGLHYYSQDLNSGSHTYTANTLPLLPSPSCIFKTLSWGCRDGLVVKNTGCTGCRGPRLESQHPHGS